MLRNLRRKLRDGWMALALAPLLVMGGLCGTAVAQTLDTAQATNDICKKSLDDLAELESKEAFDRLAPYWPISEAELQRIITDTQGQLQALQKQFGDVIDVEWVRTQQRGQSLLRHSYLLKFERHAIRVECFFYKATDFWLVNAVRWDDQIERLFD